MNFWSKQPFSKKSFLTKNIFFFLKHCWSDRSEKLHAGPPDNFGKKRNLNIEEGTSRSLSSKKAKTISKSSCLYTVRQSTHRD